VWYAAAPEEAVHALVKDARAGAVVLTGGAGHVSQMGQAVLEGLER
jgi:hypothetical protein